MPLVPEANDTPVLTEEIGVGFVVRLCIGMTICFARCRSCRQRGLTRSPASFTEAANSLMADRVDHKRLVAKPGHTSVLD
jgi:hypothetical protein